MHASTSTGKPLPEPELFLGHRASRAVVGLLWFVFWVVLQPLGCLGDPVVISTPTTIEEGDLTYDGADLVIQGTTVTLNGAHAFNSLLLRNGAVLTHSACTAVQTYKLEVNVTGVVEVDATSQIDVSGKGYLAGRTSGNTGVGGSTGMSGGSYGGVGGTRAGTSNRVYGDYADPNDWGSGGSDGPGGGLLRLQAGDFLLDGLIRASDGGGCLGGGSGGGILVRVDRLRGTGAILAGANDNNTCNGGIGGGGRIAIYARDFSEFSMAKITASGGTSLSVAGGAGTVYIRDTDQPNGILYIKQTNGGGGWTRLGTPSSTTLRIDDAVVIDGERVTAGNANDDLSINFAGGLSVRNNGTYQVIKDLAIDSPSVLSITAGGRVIVGGSLRTSIPVEIGQGGKLTCKEYWSDEELRLVGATMVAESLSVRDLELIGGSVLSHPACTASQTYKLDVNVTGSVNIDSESRIDVSGRGYLAGRTTGNTTVGAATGRSGGSHGGRGGVGFEGTSNAVYGDYADPEDWGAGGGAFTDLYWGMGGPGGGIVRVKAAQLHLDGSVRSNGSGGGGGGAGGSVRIDVGTLTGSGLVSADGGNGGGAGGGGGRIAVYARDYSGFPISQINARGGSSGGGAGTVSVFNGHAHTHVRYTVPGKLPVFPTNNYTIPNPTPFTNGLAVHFNRAIDTQSFSPAKLQIRGPQGPVVPAEILEIGDRIYRFSFPPQTDNGSYRFTLDSSFLDEDGFALDQDADGIPGEPEDTFAFTLILDTVPPRFTHQDPAADIAGTLAHIDLWSSEALDLSTFTPSVARLTNSLGASLAVSSVQQIGLNRWRLAFPARTEPAVYGISFIPGITDLAGNPINLSASILAPVNLVPVDLQLADVQVNTNLLIAGDPIQVSWTGRNATGAPLLGSWTDGVYLSEDDTWDIRDILISRVTHTGGLAADEVYTVETTAYVPGVLPGHWHLVVRADIYNQAKEGLGEADNQTAFGPIPSTVRALIPNGEAVLGTFHGEDRRHFYAIAVEPGNSLRIRLDGQTPGTIHELHAGFETMPSATRFDQRSVAVSADQEILMTGPPSGGTIYLQVYGSEVGAGSTYRLDVEAGEFFATTLTPATHGLLSRAWGWRGAGVRESARLTLSGVGFDSNTTVEFVGTDHVSRSPDAVAVVSPESLVIDLEPGYLGHNGVPEPDAWPPGSYEVRIRKGARTSVLAHAFTVTAPALPQFNASLVVPNAMSPGFPVKQTIWVEYANTGGAAMASPWLRVTAGGTAVLTLDEAEANAIRSGTASSAHLSGVVNFMAAGSGSTPGTLHPGDRGRVPVYYLGLRSDNRANSIEFFLRSSKPDDLLDQPCPPPITSGRIGAGAGRRSSLHSLGDSRCPGERFRMDWSDTTGRALRPESISEEAWLPVFQNIARRAAPDVAHYITLLADRMNDLAAAGQRTTDPGELFNFEVALASASVHPVRTLAAAVDASAPAPGFPLVFRRAFANGILPRNRLGALGRGWAHNWEVSVQRLSDGRVVIHGPGGADRMFRPATGGYVGSPGDAAKLTESGGIFRLTEPDQTVFQFDSEHRLESVADSNGNQVMLAYANGSLATLTHSNGKQFRFEHDAQGRLVRLTDVAADAGGQDRITVFGYDASGQHLVSVRAPGDRVTSYAYATTALPQQRHALQEVVHADQTWDAFAYDDEGRLLRTSQNCCGGAQETTYAFPERGTVVVTDATGRSTHLTYGMGGQLARVRDGEGRVVRFDYDATTQLAQMVGPGGERYRYSYDGKGNLTAVDDPLRYNNSFVYEAAFNRLTQVRDARGYGLQYDYDARGNLAAITYTDGTAERFTYDDHGNVATSMNRRGDGIAYTYNAAGQLTSKDYDTTPGITDFDYAYDAAGNLTQAASWNAQLGVQETTEFQYDPETDRLLRIDYPGGQFFAFEYDAAGRRTRRVDQDGHLTAYLYDELGRLARMTNEVGASIVTYEYDPAGRLGRKTLGNGVCTTYAYNDAGQVVELTNTRADNTVLSRFVYTYDASGRRDSMTTLAGKEIYGYDPLGQLVSVGYPDGRVVEYHYDAAGNRVEVTDNGVATPYAANSLNQYTSVGDTRYTYDLDGNLVEEFVDEDGQHTTNKVFTYDAENRLIGVETPERIWVYTYDALGNRVSTTHNGQTTRYVVDPTGLGNVAAEYDGAGNVVARYEHGFGLLSRNNPAGNPAYYTFSAIGHTSELTDSAGAVVNSYAYEPFGILIGKVETVANPFALVGEAGVLSDLSDISSMRMRIYSAKLGRFMQKDLLLSPARLDPYGYAANSPQNLIDALGLFRTWDFVESIGTIASGVGMMAGGIAAAPGTLGWSAAVSISFAGPIIGLGMANAITAAFDLPPPPLTGNPFKDIGNAWDDPTWRSFWELMDVLSHIHTLPRSSAKYLTSFYDLGLKNIEIYHRVVERWIELPSTQIGIFPGLLARSSDPNDKLGPSGYGENAYITSDGVMSYQIRFENQPSATAPAQRVIVTDTLDASLDLDTFELVAVAFADQTVTFPPGLREYAGQHAFRFSGNDVLADIHAELNRSTRTLRLTIQAIDPATGWAPEDPLIGLLAPEDGTGRGQGSISFVVRPKAGLGSGTRIENRARIWFDWNDPIDTPLIHNTLDVGMPESRVLAITPPAPGGRTFVVEWSATDDVAGSGLAGVDLYASSDGTNYVRVFEGGDASTTGAEVTVETAGTYWFYSVARDHVGHEEPAPVEPDAEVTVVDAVAATVTARHVFYNRSVWDGQDGGATVGDDSAIAVDKSPLLPGQTAAFGHYTSFSRGLNGVMVDIAGLAGTPTAADFGFNVSNSNSPDSWGPAPPPSSVTVRSGAGIDGSDRVTLIWPDNAIQQQWLQITVLANANTGLAVPDVFYFGNAVGDTGDSVGNAQVNVLDEAAIRAHPRNFLSPAPIDWAWDINRDRNVNVQDEAIARAHSTSFLNALKLITVPAATADANALLVEKQKSLTPTAKSAAESRSSALRMQGDVQVPTTSRDSARSSLGDGSVDHHETGTLGSVSVRWLDANRLSIEVPWSGEPTGVLETAESIGVGDDAWKEVGIQGDRVEFGVLRWTVPIQRTRPHQYFRIRQNPNPER